MSCVHEEGQGTVPGHLQGPDELVRQQTLVEMFRFHNFWRGIARIILAYKIIM